MTAIFIWKEPLFSGTDRPGTATVIVGNGQICTPCPRLPQLPSAVTTWSDVAEAEVKVSVRNHNKQKNNIDHISAFSKPDPLHVCFIYSCAFFFFFNY